MSVRIGTRVSGETARRSAVLEIDVKGRWEALALLKTLLPYRSFLVQHHGDRWVVHARAPGRHGESLDGALEAIARWSRAHPPGTSSCRVDGRPYQLSPGGRR